MSPPRRFEDDELLALLALAEDDPRLEPVRTDPASWARFLALREFLAPGPEPRGARVEEASRHLRAAVSGALAESAPAAAPRAERATGAGRIARSHSARWGRWQWGGLAAAAAVLVITVVMLPRRDGAPRERGSGATVALEGARPAEGGVRLAWRGVPGADGYEVRLLTSGLQPLGPARTTAETTLVVSREGGLAGVPPAGTVLWRVTAVRLGTPLAGSTIGSFTLP